MIDLSCLSIHPVEGGARLRLRVKTKAATDALLGVHGDALKLQVREAPEKGRANRAICALLAGALGLPAAAVTIAAGETSRDKAAQIEGLAPEALRLRLAAALEPGRQGR
ncbi:MAG: DUF167 domain-containing protein [Candidatus Eisenbacteria bacterium]|nr:DUF167 family protein [Candidatus Eisenbacteria bacterium]